MVAAQSANEFRTLGADYDDDSYYDDCYYESTMMATTMLRPRTPSSRLKSRLMIYDDATTVMTTMMAATMIATTNLRWWLLR